MFGMRMIIDNPDLFVELRPFKKEDLELVAEGFQSMQVLMYTKQLFAQTLENEQEWYERMRLSKDDVVWAIVPDGKDKPVGVTALHNINNFAGSCTSGIIIWDINSWGKGIARNSHLARTLFAADFLNRSTIRTKVIVDNNASLKALQGVGYIVTGLEPKTAFRQGQFLNSHNLIWLNPDRISVLFPEGLPEQYKDGVEKAEVALYKARKIVKFK